MGLYSLSTSASLIFCNLSPNPRNPTLHHFGFLSTTFASPLRTSSSSVYVQRACDIGRRKSVGRRVSFRC